MISMSKDNGSGEQGGLVTGLGLGTVFAQVDESTEVPQLDPDLFVAALEYMWALPLQEAAMGAVAVGRNAFGLTETYLLPAFRVSFDEGNHDKVLDATRSNGGSVVVMALGLTQNRVGRNVENYGVFWRDERNKSSLWFTNAVALDPDRHGEIKGR